MREVRSFFYNLGDLDVLELVCKQLLNLIHEEIHTLVKLESDFFSQCHRESSFK